MPQDATRCHKPQQDATPEGLWVIGELCVKVDDETTQKKKNKKSKKKKN